MRKLIEWEYRGSLLVGFLIIVGCLSTASMYRALIDLVPEWQPHHLDLDISRRLKNVDVDTPAFYLLLHCQSGACSFGPSQRYHRAGSRHPGSSCGAFCLHCAQSWSTLGGLCSAKSRWPSTKRSQHRLEHRLCPQSGNAIHEGP